MPRNLLRIVQKFRKRFSLIKFWPVNLLWIASPWIPSEILSMIRSAIWLDLITNFPLFHSEIPPNILSQISSKYLRWLILNRKKSPGIQMLQYLELVLQYVIPYAYYGYCIQDRIASEILPKKRIISFWKFPQKFSENISKIP